MNNIRVVLVDDHAILREGLRVLISQQTDIEVVGEAGDGREALEKIAQLQPDIVVMDISMAGMDGLEATRQLNKMHPNTRVIVLTQHDDPVFINSLLEAGVAGYVLKRMGGARVIDSIRGVYQEGAYLPPEILKQLLRKSQMSQDSETTLTQREKEVLKLVAEGFSSQEIAEKLFLSAKTVSVHRTNLMRKLGLHKSTELVRYALRQGLIKL